MNDWGIPDWRDAAAYGDTGRWSLNRWRWEFYRRRADLRDYFDARAEAVFQAKIHELECNPERFPDGRVRKKDEPGFCVPVDYAAQSQISYSVLGNPRIGAQPYHVIWPFDPDGKISTYGSLTPSTFGESLEVAKVQLDAKQEFILQHWKDRQGLDLGADEFAIKFDLNRALEPQLKMARDWLWAQYKIRNKPPQRRRHKTKWLGYLRTLDAREAGASWREISRLHNSTAQTEQTARDIWEAADALRFKF